MSRRIAIEPLRRGGHAAALVSGGRIEDLLIDPPAGDEVQPQAIFLARAGRPMKGQGGMIADLGKGRSGFLRARQSFPPSGSLLPVQISGWAEPGKARPVSDRLTLKGVTAILTPQSPGHNVARSVTDKTRRAELTELAGDVLGRDNGAPGCILRSASETAQDEFIAEELARLLGAWREIEEQASRNEPGLLLEAPGAADIAFCDWSDPETELLESPQAFDDTGIWEELTSLSGPLARLGEASMFIEATRALVAVDINTGGDFSPAAGLKANLAALRDLPRQLRLRGLGGQITVDPAPMPRKERGRAESALTAALRRDGVTTTIAGWSPLGHLELQRARARRTFGSADFEALGT